jgi:hypothetical protein
MLWLGNRFPQMDLHVEMIMTQHLIDAVLSDKFQFPLFQQVLRCSLDFIEPSSGLYFKNKYECQKELPGFFPTKSSFIEFLNKEKNILNLEKLFAMDYRSNELHYHEDGIRAVATDRRITAGKCKLKDTTRKYDIGFIDSDVPMRDVVLLFLETYGD